MIDWMKTGLYCIGSLKEEVEKYCSGLPEEIHGNIAHVGAFYDKEDSAKIIFMIQLAFQENDKKGVILCPPLGEELVSVNLKELSVQINCKTKLYYEGKQIYVTYSMVYKDYYLLG
jgi:hypothetical protein